MTKERGVIVFAVGAVLLAVAWYAFRPKDAAVAPVGPVTSTSTVSSTGNGTATPPQGPDAPSIGPAETVIRAYYDALDAGRAEEAHGHLSRDLAASLPPERLAQASEALRSIRVTRTATWAKDGGREQYETFFQVQVEPGGLTSFSNGENVRVIELVQEEGSWKISKINLRPDIR